MLNVALTGNIGAGKSSVTELFTSWGATVIDADRITHELQQSGSSVFQRIVERFGVAVVDERGQLNRPALRALVLADPQALRDLNAIVHPAVAARRSELEAAARARGDRILINDIPLLFEVGRPEEFDRVILVDAPEPVRRARLGSRGLSGDEIDRLCRAQIPSEVKRGRSDIVIDNIGTFDDLRAAALRAWESLERQAPPHA